MKAKLIYAILLCLAGAMNASAQEYLTLDRAVTLALDQNRMLKGADYERTAAHWGTLNAWSSYMPKVDLLANYTRIDKDTELRSNAAIDFIRGYSSMLGIPPSALANFKPFAYLNTFASGFAIVQPIYNGGGELVAIAAAQATSDRSESAYIDAEQEVVAKVKTAYYAVVKAEAFVVLAKDAAERTRRYLDLTRRRAEIGQRTKTDVLRWEVQLAAEEGNIIQAENGLALARLMLNEAMGVDLDRQFAVPKPDSTEVLADITGNDSSAPGTANPPGLPSVENHPSLKVMDANLQLASIQTQQAWVNFKPRLNLAFQYGWERNNTAALDGIRPWALSLVVSWPIFNGFGDYTNLQRAKAEEKKTEVQVEAYRRGLTIQATNAQLGVNAAKKRIETTRKGQDEAHEVLLSVTRRYESGAASNVDLIDAQVAYTAARANFITALYDFYVARIQYARATGSIAP